MEGYALIYVFSDENEMNCLKETWSYQERKTKFAKAKWSMGSTPTSHHRKNCFRQQRNKNNSARNIDKKAGRNVMEQLFTQFAFPGTFGISLITFWITLGDFQKIPRWQIRSEKKLLMTVKQRHSSIFFTDSRVKYLMKRTMKRQRLLLVTHHFVFFAKLRKFLCYHQKITPPEPQTSLYKPSFSNC